MSDSDFDPNEVKAPKTRARPRRGTCVRIGCCRLGRVPLNPALLASQAGSMDPGIRNGLSRFDWGGGGKMRVSEMFSKSNTTETTLF